MATVIEEVKLILADVGVNSNKFWTGRLFDNNDVETHWGRVGDSGQSKMFPSNGKSFLDKKVREKLAKGYTELKVVESNAPAKVKDVGTNQLHEIAKKQIQHSGDPLVQKLIERLVKENIHRITSATAITYNADAGTFSTPLGVVTQDAIDEARQMLAIIEKHVSKDDYSASDFIDAVNKYLRLIPQNAGRKLNVRVLFPDNKAIKNQSDILDSLEASYKAVTTAPKKKGTKKTDAPEEKVFEVHLEVVTDKDLARIKKLYEKTWQAKHQSRNLKVKSAYKVTMPTMAEAFEKGKQCGNVMELWHGTKSANLLSILKSGLKLAPPSSVGITGKMFGNGIYFSDQSTKSLNYASGYWDGSRNRNCFMFLADVAMGNYYVPAGSNERLPKSGYDSTFAKANQSGVMNNEMIVYNENQYNLTYLVEFEE